MQIPASFLESLNGLPGFDRDAFLAVHTSGKPATSVRLNPSKATGQIAQTPLSRLTPVPWTRLGYYLDERPSFTFDPLFHAGCYYVQEASSMFLEQAIKQTIDLGSPLKVLDLCAAPGGKSTHIQSLLSGDSLLVSNEVIGSRAKILTDNIIRWGAENVVVTNNDPSHFRTLEEYFDLVVADAPCSGSGLFRKEAEAIGEWSEHNVQLCSQRQQRILAEIIPSLKAGGVLIYSTCSYSKEEDEDIVNWLMKEFPLVQLTLSADPAWGITGTGSGYRFWPDKLRGEGFFMACFKKMEETGELKKVKGEREKRNRQNLIEMPGQKDLAIIRYWVQTEGKQLIRSGTTLYAWPEMLAGDIRLLATRLSVIYSGVRIGEVIRDKLIPDHALAMSRILSEHVDRIAFPYEKAIRYLQRKEISPEGMGTGWQLITYEDQPLGWVNVLPRRVNNYYPRELRILKEV